jgi:predicted RNase H-like HicB family nuclease
MVEFQRYPLRVQQSKLDGWWFIFVDEVPELGVIGPNYEELLDQLKVMARKLFRARGEAVTEIEISPSEMPALRVFH